MKIENLINYLRIYPDLQELEPMQFLLFAKDFANIEQLDIDSYIAKVGETSLDNLTDLSESIWECAKFIRKNWKEIACSVEFDDKWIEEDEEERKRIEENLNEAARLDECLKELQSHIGEERNKGPFEYTLSDGTIISTSNLEEAISTLEDYIVDFKFKADIVIDPSLLDDSLTPLEPGETKHIVSQLSKLADLASERIELYLKKEKDKPRILDIEFSPIISGLTGLINKYPFLRKENNPDSPLRNEEVTRILSLQNVNDYKIQSRKKLFVLALIKSVSENAMDTRSAEKWKEKAIETFGLQVYSKKHPFERNKATRPVDDFYDELSEICRSGTDSIVLSLLRH